MAASQLDMLPRRAAKLGNGARGAQEPERSAGDPGARAGDASQSSVLQSPVRSRQPRARPRAQAGIAGKKHPMLQLQCRPLA